MSNGDDATVWTVKYTTTKILFMADLKRIG